MPMSEGKDALNKSGQKITAGRNVASHEGLTQEEVKTIEIVNGVALVTLNRPHVMNALNIQLREELIQSSRDLDSNPDVSVIVFTGAGEKAFCAGADLKERGRRSAQEQYEERRYFRSKWISVVASMVKPTIAAINGYCLGGGLELALQCDLRIASENAKFGLPEVTIGVLPGAGATQRLPRAIGLQKAKELILTGRRFDAREAEALGLVLRVVPQNEVVPQAIELARTIAANPTMSVVQAKLALNASQETPLSAGLQFENEAWLSCILNDDWKSKIERFAK